MKNIANSRSKFDQNYYQSIGNQYRQRVEFQAAALFRALYIWLLFRPKSVLDVGCGMGNLVEILRKLGIETYGIEISDYALTQIPKRLQPVCQKSDILAVPFGNKSFDVVTTVNVLEHIATKSLKKALSECERVARFGIFHEITVVEDKRTIDLDPTHTSKYLASWWWRKLDSFYKPKGWQVVKGLTVPIFKHGIFYLKR